MRHEMRYDVIIIGAGPGGALLAYLLASKGVSALIIEKKPLPRYKACGGGLTGKTLDLLPFDIGEIIEDKTHTVKIFLNNTPVFVKTLDQPVISMVMRDRFDHFLTQQAIRAGADVVEGAAFKTLSGPAGGLLVETSDKTFRSRLLVGADGVNSRAAKALGLNIKRNTMTAMEGEVCLKEDDALNRFKTTAHFDFGVIPKGYGWIFPKSDHLSIGLLTVSEKAEQLEPYVRRYIKMKGLDASSELRSLKGHLIPFRRSGNSLSANEKGLLIGDAAGITDPVTGEGIYYAVREAFIASDVITAALESGYDRMTAYNIRLQNEFGREMACARRIARFMHAFPGLRDKLLMTQGDKIGGHHLDIISGAKTYRELHDRIFRISKLMPILTSALFK